MAFRTVNCRTTPGFDPSLHRHHILPLQVLRMPSFRPLFAALGPDRLCFDDFRANGVLLPANDDAAIRHGLPLHRGPHRNYNAMVIERVGQIERTWASSISRYPDGALRDAYERLALLQRALRRRLLDQRKRIVLNRRDPLGAGIDFAELDAMADVLWPATAPPED
nr:AHH domain-containing protein [Novosphingobium kunmingense]